MIISNPIVFKEYVIIIVQLVVYYLVVLQFVLSLNDYGNTFNVLFYQLLLFYN